MIPAGAIEAVAIAWTGEREWQLHSQPWRNDRLEEVGQILEAAMPNILAHAWDEGLAKGGDVAAWAIGGRPEAERPNTENPYRSAK